MRKRIVLLVLITACMLSGYGQDLIYLFNGQVLKVKVSSINRSHIFYHEYNNPQGHLKHLNKPDVVMVQYENGTFNIFALPARELKKKDSIAYKNNLISFHNLDLFFNDFTISYERILKGGKTGIQIPVSIGVGHPRYDNNNNMLNKLSAGFVLNYYPSGQRKFNYFTGLMLLMGYGNGVEYTDSNGYAISNNKLNPALLYGKFLVNNGLCWNIYPAIRLSFYIGAGLVYYDKRVSTKVPAGFDINGRYSLNVSFRF